MNTAMSERVRIPSLALAGLLLWVFLAPAPAVADLQSDLEAAMDQLIGQLNGLEIDEPSFEYDHWGVHFTFTVVGMALCEPTDPWAEPALAPEPPYNSYGCTNASTTAVDVVPGEQSAVVVLQTENLFLDFELLRDWGICILLTPCTECVGSGSPVPSEGYLLGDATLTVGLAITDGSPCPTVAVQPGSVALEFGDPALEIRDDACLASLVSTLKPLVVPVFEDALSGALESYLISVGDEMNDMICNTTPTQARSWSDLKSDYRTTR